MLYLVILVQMVVALVTQGKVSVGARHTGLARMDSKHLAGSQAASMCGSNTRLLDPSAWCQTTGHQGHMTIKYVFQQMDKI